MQRARVLPISSYGTGRIDGVTIEPERVPSEDGVPSEESVASEESAAPRSASSVLAGLDDDQRAAVLAPRGPVCILAGAGTGKTRAITHRIAYGVLTGATAPQHVLAVTFTARAAGEMRGRLRELGVSGVQARTFHAAALRQLRYFAPRVFFGRAMPELVDRKAALVGQSASRAGVRLDRTGVRDVTSEIEWAKSSLVDPDDFVVAAEKAGRDLPLDGSALARVYAAYEEAKRRGGVIDFEDLLRATVWAIEEHRDVAEQVRSQYRHFVVDEYQDVNPLQQRLLDAWLGGRDDLCVVGDASQTIYSFTGASPSHLIDFGRRHPGSTVVRLERDYRSTPQVVGLANQVIAGARGEAARVRLRLVGQRAPGPEPRVAQYDDEPAEAAAVAERCAALVAAGTPPSEIAVLFRVNAQSEAYEQALAQRGLAYVVRGGERFFERPEIREALVLLRGAARSVEAGHPLLGAVTDVLTSTGFDPGSRPSGGAARERWEALAALVRLAEDAVITGLVPADAVEGLPALNDELASRAAAQHAPTVEGVTLASLHAAKGLEWDAVFLVGLAEGTMPIIHAKTPEQLEEERRLLYVGVTRAREHLWLSWAASRAPGGRGGRRPCRFLPADLSHGGAAAPARPGRAKRKDRGLPVCRACGVALFDPLQRKLRRCSSCPADPDEELFERLRTWRLAVASGTGVPAYVVFTDATLTAIAEDRPTTVEGLGEIPGVGPRKIAQYGDAVLALVGGAEPESVLEPAADTD
jgi:DNA helicase-2/ATP-dependent DNA helicase PcrA